MNISKYFWDVNEKSLKEIKVTLSNPQHHLFTKRLAILLSRCDRPREVFSVIPQEEFIRQWPLVKKYWRKLDKKAPLCDWWQTIYEQLIEEQCGSKKHRRGKTSYLFKKFGSTIRQARINKGLSQTDLALQTDMKQPEISLVEEGKRNITLETLFRLCKILKISWLDLTDISQKCSSGKTRPCKK